MTDYFGQNGAFEQGNRSTVNVKTSECSNAASLPIFCRMQNWGGFRVDEKLMADANNIREMNLETDLGRVAEIWLRWVERTAPPLKSGESWKSKLSNLESEAQHFKNQKYVYEEDGTIKGFIIAGVLNGSPYLYELYVDCQGKGIGTKLLDKIRKIYRYLNSHVYECNPYLKFYLKHGFEVCGKHACCDTGKNKLMIRW